MEPESAKNSEPQRGRRLVNLLLGSGVLASIASFIYPAFRYIIPPPVPEASSQTVVAGKVADFKRNTGAIFKFGEKPGILLYTAQGEWKAFSAICTHLNCTVQYRDDVHQIWCACHNGFYDLRGRNVSGPPPRPLEEYAVHIQGEDVVVQRKA
ncbi:MAG: Rieske 2Fe-2S domain-containing protein [Acidobacteria bacterium]|nr:Rieske 2Fe-2S domain-containing protein [Acidobacteriota bacterium]